MHDRITKQVVFCEVGGGDNVPGIPGTCATRNFTYLVRGPWLWCKFTGASLYWIVFLSQRRIQQASQDCCLNGPLARYRKLWVASAPGMPGKFSPPPKFWVPKRLASDRGMQHGTCVTHVPWCKSGSQTRGGGENVPGIPDTCTTRNCTYLARVPLLHSVSGEMCSEP